MFENDIVDDIEELFGDDDEDIINIVEGPRRSRIFRDRPNHFQIWTDQEFLERFRLSKITVQNLCYQVNNHLEHPTQQNHAVTPMEQLLIALRFYAAGSMLIVCSDFAGVHDSTASRIVKKVSQVIARLAQNIIKYPETDEELMTLNNDFFRIANFPNVIGTIDCTHIRLQSPGGKFYHPLRFLNFRNRKGWFLLNIQTISDAQLKIRDIVARWPGSTSDRTIFANSRIKGEFERGRFRGSFLLGDSGYTLSEYLITPLPQPMTPAENVFNESHIRTRNTVERQYGIWKRRFPVLRLELRLKLETVLSVIVATAVLHNLAINNNDDLPQEELGAPEENQFENIDLHNDNLNNGNLVRQDLIDNYFSLLLE